MTDTKRAILNLYYAAAEGREPSSRDMADAGIPVHLHDRVRTEAHTLLVDHYSSNDLTAVRRDAQRLGTALAMKMPADQSRTTAAKNEMVAIPKLNDERHPIASMYLQIAEGGEPSDSLLQDAGIPSAVHHQVRTHAAELRELWTTGEQEEARRQSIRYAHETIAALGDQYTRQPPDDPRALADLVR
jgi:hypothetical protein